MTQEEIDAVVQHQRERLRELQQELPALRRQLVQAQAHERQVKAELQECEDEAQVMYVEGKEQKMFTPEQYARKQATRSRLRKAGHECNKLAAQIDRHERAILSREGNIQFYKSVWPTPDATAHWPSAWVPLRDSIAR